MLYPNFCKILKPQKVEQYQNFLRRECKLSQSQKLNKQGQQEFHIVLRLPLYLIILNLLFMLFNFKFLKIKLFLSISH